jgi:hypothetical protein
VGSGKEYTMAEAFTTRKRRRKADSQNYPCYNDLPMKQPGENRKQVFGRAMNFSCVPFIVCLLVCGLLPVTGEARQSQASDQAGFSASCPGPHRLTARPQNLTLAQGKTTRRQVNLAPATSNSWSSVIQIEGHPAHTSYSRATYSSLQISHPSDRAPPSLAASNI